MSQSSTRCARSAARSSPSSSGATEIGCFFALGSRRPSRRSRARTWEQQALAAEGLATVLAARSGLPPDDLGTRVIAAAISATAIIVADVWQASGGHDDIATLFDAAATALSDSFRRGA